MTNLNAQDRLAVVVLLIFVVAALAMVFSSLVPMFWHEKFYIDGLTIIDSTPSFEPFNSSFNSAAFLLQPWILLARFLGGQVANYGTNYDIGLLITNGVFGITALAIFSWFALRFQPVITLTNLVAVGAAMVLLAPFYFCITKELVTLIGAVLPLAIWARRPDKTGLGLAVYVASMAFLGVYFRAYYLLYALILCVNLVSMRKLSFTLIVYGGALVVIWVLFSRLPWDLLTKGRAEYLEGVSASRIEYYLSDDGFVGFIGNRALAFLTMLFPINLMLRSPAYTPFVLLQIWISLRMVALLKERAAGMVGFANHAILSFTMVQALFEPDYGSYFRHRVGLLLFILLVLCRFSKIPQIKGFDSPKSDNAKKQSHSGISVVGAAASVKLPR